VGDDPDDPRAPFHAEGAGRFAVFLAAELASDALAPGVWHALSCSSDTVVGPSTVASDAPPPGTLRCNSGFERTTAGNSSGNLSAGSSATR
jgi:hypothetical protein